MDEKQALAIIEEFSKQATNLENSEFVKLVLEDIHLREMNKDSLFQFQVELKEDKSGNGTISIMNNNGSPKTLIKVTEVPNEDYTENKYFKAVIPYIQSFIQQEEKVSIANLAKAYKRLNSRKYYLDRITETQNWLKKNIVDTKWEIDQKDISHWEILQIYFDVKGGESGLSSDTWEEWMSNPFLKSIIFQSLHLSASTISIKVIGLLRLNELLLTEINQGQNFQSALYIVKEDSSNLEDISTSVLKEMAQYVIYNNQDFLNFKLHDIIEFNNEKFQIMSQSIDLEDNKLIGILRCIKIDLI